MRITVTGTAREFATGIENRLFGYIRDSCCNIGIETEAIDFVETLASCAMNKALICPVCRNESISAGDNYCCICGRQL